VRDGALIAIAVGVGLVALGTLGVLWGNLTDDLRVIGEAAAVLIIGASWSVLGGLYLLYLTLQVIADEIGALTGA
jgi:hypothetical protein